MKILYYWWMAFTREDVKNAFLNLKVDMDIVACDTDEHDIVDEKFTETILLQCGIEAFRTGEFKGIGFLRLQGILQLLQIGKVVVPGLNGCRNTQDRNDDQREDSELCVQTAMHDEIISRNRTFFYIHMPVMGRGRV